MEQKLGWQKQERLRDKMSLDGGLKPKNKDGFSLSAAALQ